MNGDPDYKRGVRYVETTWTVPVNSYAVVVTVKEGEREHTTRYEAPTAEEAYRLYAMSGTDDTAEIPLIVTSPPASAEWEAYCQGSR